MDSTGVLGVPRMVTTSATRLLAGLPVKLSAGTSRLGLAAHVWLGLLGLLSTGGPLGRR